MSRSKKTRTKSTEAGPPRHIRRLQQIKTEVASEAARIIATEGQHNYHAAKKKAAERVGVSERLALPSNIEVKEALLRYQSLYGGNKHSENLQALRETAVTVMQKLDLFHPRLVGAVLDGTAGAHSRISLHVFAESTESVILHFLEFGMPFKQEQRQIRWHDGKHRTVPLIVFEINGATVELTVMEPVGLRQAPPSPIDGKPQRRATQADVECLLAETATALTSQGPN
ncbi:MAG: hypothetical protein HKN57_13415 [Xanthomonadales bacterium]|nr:hypothetical protein [Gammaproteobacteria bacterium]MBT8055085.1 hypothetical protein [Gammaproteobacteria bacterium]NND58238.1 hypothetical protein [Xanthomonadales bacterium]NNK51679.1 hypothetical protein [Xanthomonadales bacterium]